MSPVGYTRRPGGPRFPRVSGDEPAGKTAVLGQGLFSPRERG